MIIRFIIVIVFIEIKIIVIGNINFTKNIIPIRKIIVIRFNLLINIIIALIDFVITIIHKKSFEVLIPSSLLLHATPTSYQHHY